MDFCFEHVSLFRWRGSWHYDGGDEVKSGICPHCIAANTEDCPFDCAHNQERVVVNTNPVPLFSGFRMNRKGWICPRCDTVVSPDEKTCPNCKPAVKKESDNGKRTHIAE